MAPSAHETPTDRRSFLLYPQNCEITPEKVPLSPFLIGRVTVAREADRLRPVRVQPPPRCHRVGVEFQEGNVADPRIAKV